MDCEELASNMAHFPATGISGESRQNGYSGGGYDDGKESRLIAKNDKLCQKLQEINGISKNNVSANVQETFETGNRCQSNGGGQRKNVVPESFEPCSYLLAFYTYFSYAVLAIVGYVNDIVRPRASAEKNRQVNFNQADLRSVSLTLVDQCVKFSARTAGSWKHQLKYGKFDFTGLRATVCKL